MKKLAALFLLAFALFSPAKASVTCSLPFNLQNGTIADATQVMANYNALLSCFGNAAASGVNSDITALTALSTPLTPAQGGTPLYIGGTSTGSGNTQVVGSTTPISFTLTAGKTVTFIAGFTNTGAATLNVASTGAIAVKKLGQAGIEALTGGEIVATNPVWAYYDGTEFVLTVQPVFDIGPQVTIASATTTDLGTVPSHNATISGATTITSFGSSASVNEPIYYLTFSGAMTLTYDGTALILPGGGNITTVAGDTAVAMYLSTGNWRVVSYTRGSGQPVVPSQPVQGSFKNLAIKVLTNTTVGATADQVVMWDTSNNPFTGALTSTGGTAINLGTTGANALDAGTIATSTWYAIWAIAKPDGTVAGLASTSFTAPTMPTGYTYKARVGAVRTISGSATLRGTWQFNRRAQYVVGLAQTTTAVVMTSGAAGSASVPTWVAVDTTAFVPPTASRILGSLFNSGNAVGASAAPNSSYGSNSSLTNPPPVSSFSGATNSTNAIPFEFALESSNIYWGSLGSGGALSVIGWEDNL